MLAVGPAGEVYTGHMFNDSRRGPWLQRLVAGFGFEDLSLALGFSCVKGFGFRVFS